MTERATATCKDDNNEPMIIAAAQVGLSGRGNQHSHDNAKGRPIVQNLQL
ncbi:MAG TPA: hypothetical protein VKD71_16275 [Gemmataceae bacterium]|nr:hypothetical protein [Gemmataceae bacterium]